MSWTEIWNWLTGPEGTKLFWVPVAAILVGAFLVWLGKQIPGTPASALRVFRGLLARNDNLSESLAAYRSALDQATFRVKHAWMKEEQTLDDILVPVVIESKSVAGRIEDWSLVLQQLLRAGEASP